MLTRKKLRLFILLYLLVTLVGIIFSYPIVKTSSVSPSDQTEFQKLVKQDSAFVILLMIAPILWLLCCANFLFLIFSLISLAWFWKCGPNLFTISFILSKICLPILGWFYALQTEKYPLFSNSKYVSQSILFQPFNLIDSALAGAILVIIYSSLGKHLFKKQIMEEPG